MDNKSTRVDNTSHSLLQKTLDCSISGMMVYEMVKQGNRVNPQFLIQLVNRRAEEIVGLSRDELNGRFVHDVFPEDAQRPIWSDVLTVIQTGEPCRQELFYSNKRTGKAAWFDVLIESISDGRCVVISFNEITEWKQAQQSLLSDSILFKTLSSTVPEMGVIAIDFFRKIALANGSIPGLFKSKDPDELVGRRFLDTIEARYAEDWQRYLTTAFDGEQHYFTDHWGGWRCEVYVGPVRNATGQIVMVLAVYKNVSEQYQQQQALQQANNSLHRSNQNLEQFAYIASHDLQEPLRKIRSFGELLNKRYSDKIDDSGRDLIDRMQSAALRMDELIRSLLSFSRINTPTLTNTITVDLENLLDGIQSDLEMVIQEKNAIIDVQPPMPIVPGDEGQLRQLFQNLLTNALKFVSPGTEPRIVVSSRLINGSEVPDHPTAGRNPETQYAEISVSDNGIGIARENFEKIFGLFTRLHGRTSYAGTGIGLATTRRVVENHGGTITIRSEEHKGTTFNVYLPVVIAS